MNALVVYESLWGNTKAIAEAVAEGLGDGATVADTRGARPELVAQADLLVAGAPILGFNLPTAQMRRSIESNPVHATHPPDLSHPAIREWLDTLPTGPRFCASFETRIWWSPGSSAKRIARHFEVLGYQVLGTPQRFVVEGTYGPLKDGELQRARAWGEELARLVAAARAL